MLYLSLSMYNISRRIWIVFVREQLCNKLKKVTGGNPSGPLGSEASVEKVQQPTAVDNIVSNYSHPYWAEDLSVVCFSCHIWASRSSHSRLHRLCQASARTGRH